MEINFVDLKKQYENIKEEIDAAIQEVIENTAFIKGKYVENFENKFAEKLGIKHCIGVGNGTDALIISLKTLGVGYGDEVITAANSFIATSEAISAVGAKVVFVDVNPKTYTIDINKIEERITSKTKAIIPVHLYGQPADMEEIISIAKKYNLFLIEDTAQAHFAKYFYKQQWKFAGTMGDIGTFSFYPGKNLGAYGDGGAIVTNNDEFARVARMYANHGRIAKYDHEFEGYNSRLDGLQAAILSVKLKYIDDWTQKRREIANFYTELLAGVGDIVVPFANEKAMPVWHLYVIRTKFRDEIKSFLTEKGITTGIHYPIALPNLKAYKYLGYSEKDFPFATQLQNEILSLPIYPEIQKKQIIYIYNNIKRFFRSER